MAAFAAPCVPAVDDARMICAARGVGGGRAMTASVSEAPDIAKRPGARLGARALRQVWPARCASCRLRGAALCRAVAAANLPGTRPPRLHRVGRDEVLFEQGDVPRIAGVLHGGVLRLERILGDGRRSIVGLAIPGDTVGLLEVGRAAYTLEAATDAEICVFDRETVATMRARDRAFTRFLFEEAGAQQEAAQAMIWQRGALSSRERILALLATAAHAMPAETLPDGSVVVSMVLSRRDWADLANTTVESISRTLRQLSDTGLVTRVGPGRFRIADPRLLARLAGIDPEFDAPRKAGLGAAAAGPGALSAPRLTVVNDRDGDVRSVRGRCGQAHRPRIVADGRQGDAPA
jgi:CRP-like cAMP-binding protein